MEAWRFYVYEVLDSSGVVTYVGKGSGQRKHASRRQRGGSEVREVARFKRERDAYAFEIARIAEVCPPLNQHPGGNGSRAVRRRVVEPKWQKHINTLGTRKYAALLWLEVLRACNVAGVAFKGDESKVDAIREVAYG